jgi:DNA invertase Pin-like site-specific DNA recombinase
MLVGYARTSTLEQKAGFEAQLRELQDLGCERIFQERVSSVAERAELECALEFIREGDICGRQARPPGAVYARLDEHIKSKKAALRIVNLGLDTASPTGELILNVLGSIAQFERQIMLERQREGIAKAKAESHLEADPCRPGQEGRPHKIGQSSFHQIIADYKKEAEAEFVKVQHV